MKDSNDEPRAHMRADARRLYQALAQDPRYGHYVRIPERICRCLDYFNVSASRAAVSERLQSYYLFIGVVDDAMDAGRLEAGREILECLDGGAPAFAEGAQESCARLVTEVLKCHISRESYPLVLSKLEELYRAVVGEHRSETVQAYIEQRRAVGRLTAELSYLLIRPLIRGEHDGLCRFLQRVGEVGCLVDSVIDLTADDRMGLLGFKPTLADHLSLAVTTLREGLKVLSEYPRLTGLFLWAVGDDVLDRLHARGPRPAPDPLDAADERYACERAA